MRFLLKIVSIFFLSIYPFCFCQSQFITLKGRQFYDVAGQPFYPVLCNYLITYGVIPGSNTYFLSRGLEYGPYPGFDCLNASQCTEPAFKQQIIDDFVKIKSLGFNMIRPVFTPKWDKTLQKFYIDGADIYPTGSSYYGRKIILNQLSQSDPDVQNYFTYLDWIADQASQQGLFTMINGALGDITGAGGNDPGGYTQYLVFLDLLGKHFKTNPNIAFYDILSEPSYSYYPYFTKQEACSIVHDFYYALKTADPNHLITACNNGIEESTQFDVGLLTLDFSQPHIYSAPVSFDNYNVANMIDRIKGHMYWFSKNCPMPWMEGETGFKASCYFGAAFPMNGDLYDQRDYVDATLAATRNNLGSGYVWWEYQDQNGNNFSPDGFGLIALNADVNNLPIPSDPCVEKPMAASFQAYLDPTTHQPPAIDPTQNVKPPYYYDPFHNGDYNTAHTNAVSGTILDQNNNPIEDAWISGKNWLWIDNSNPLYPFKVISWIYTFSDANGDFELIPYNYVTAGDDKISWLHGSAVGAEPFKFGDDSHEETQMQNNLGPIIIKKINFQYNAFISNEIVGATDTKNFKGWNTLTINNTTIDGASDIRARQEIHIKSEFLANSGSEVHIYTDETFSECSDYDWLTTQRGINNTAQNYNSISQKEIEVRFKFNMVDPLHAVIIPNPTSGLFSIQLNAATKSNPVIIRINNPIGDNLKIIASNGSEFPIDASQFSKGIYFVEISIGNNLITKKLIIN